MEFLQEFYNFVIFFINSIKDVVNAFKSIGKPVKNNGTIVDETK